MNESQKESIGVTCFCSELVACLRRRHFWRGLKRFWCKSWLRKLKKRLASKPRSRLWVCVHWVSTHAHTHMHAHTQTHIHTHTHMHTCIHAYIHTQIKSHTPTLVLALQECQKWSYLSITFIWIGTPRRRLVLVVSSISPLLNTVQVHIGTVFPRNEMSAVFVRRVWMAQGMWRLEMRWRSAPYFRRCCVCKWCCLMCRLWITSYPLSQVIFWMTAHSSMRVPSSWESTSLK